MKQCTICAIEKPITEFYFRKDNGKYRSQCKKCWNATTKAWAQANPDARKIHRAKWEQANPGHLKIRKAKYRQRHPIEYRRWNLQNPDIVKKINAAWASKNKPKLAAAAAKRRAMLLQATPPWANHDDIEKIYIEAAHFKMEVDHIIPLQHPLVCGLHIPENLQLLTTSENRRKSNRFMPEDHE